MGKHKHKENETPSDAEKAAPSDTGSLLHVCPLQDCSGGFKRFIANCQEETRPCDFRISDADGRSVQTLAAPPNSLVQIITPHDWRIDTSGKAAILDVPRPTCKENRPGLWRNQDGAYSQNVDFCDASSFSRPCTIGDSVGSSVRSSTFGTAGFAPDAQHSSPAGFAPDAQHSSPARHSRSTAFRNE